MRWGLDIDAHADPPVGLMAIGPNSSKAKVRSGKLLTTSSMRAHFCSRRRSGDSFQVLVRWKVILSSSRIWRSRSRLTSTLRPLLVARCFCSLRTLQRVKGRPRERGRFLATLTMSARSLASMIRGRPPAHLGSRHARPASLKAWITSRTRSGEVWAMSAITLTLLPPAEAKTMSARRQVMWDLVPVPRRTIRTSRCPSASVGRRTLRPLDVSFVTIATSPSVVGEIVAASGPQVSDLNPEPGAKVYGQGTRHGSAWLKRVLLEVARAASRTKGSYFSAQYSRIARRRGPNKAAVAVANSMLAVIWHVLTHGCIYQDPGADYFERRHDPAIEAKRLQARIEALGFDVTLAPKAA